MALSEVAICVGLGNEVVRIVVLLLVVATHVDHGGVMVCCIVYVRPEPVVVASIVTLLVVSIHLLAKVCCIEYVKLVPVVVMV